MTHIEAISNGLGAQSMRMVLMAGDGELSAKLSITAETGWETDRLWSDGTRASNQVYFDQVVVPLCAQLGLDAVLVEALDRDGNRVPPLGEWVRQQVETGKLNHIKIPLFGSNGGRLRQICTSRKKVAAIRQELRRRGATTARMAHGLHAGEVLRMKGVEGRVGDGGWYTLTAFDVGWQSHFYPLIERRIFRADCQATLKDRGVPWLLSSECDGCPHKDYARWARTSPHVIDDLADLESKMNGEFFFTDKRIPLREAIAVMAVDDERKRARLPDHGMFDDDPDFGCDEGGVCGV